MSKELIWQTRDDMDAPTNPLQALRESFTRSSKDMSESKFDAWLYGIIVGWDNESYPELAKKHNWSLAEINYQKLLHKNYCELWNTFMKQ